MIDIDEILGLEVWCLGELELHLYSSKIWWQLSVSLLCHLRFCYSWQVVQLVNNFSSKNTCFFVEGRIIIAKFRYSFENFVPSCNESPNS
jgi:FtsH-binding integral membrane protein